MIGLDTNVLLRSLLADEGEEEKRARALLAGRCSPANPAFLNHVVLCEAAWVMVRTYRYSREQVATAVETILATPAFLVAERPLVEEALAVFRSSRADFADALIGVVNRRAGCDTTYAFDRRATESSNFSDVPQS